MIQFIHQHLVGRRQVVLQGLNLLKNETDALLALLNGVHDGLIHRETKRCFSYHL